MSYNTSNLGGDIVGNFGNSTALEYINDALHGRTLALDNGEDLIVLSYLGSSKKVGGESIFKHRFS